MKTFLLLILISCGGYQKNNEVIIPKVKASTVTQVDVEKDLLTLDNFNKAYDKFLKRFVAQNPNSKSFDTLVDYKLLSRTKKKNDEEFVKDFNLITQFLAKKSNLKDLNKNQKIALMINAYNFFTIDLISNYIEDGIKSITEIENKGFGIFDLNVFNFNGSNISLNTLEKKQLYSLVSNSNGTIDARFHFAVICGALGCPILLDEVYVAEKLDSQLDDITRKGLLLPRNLSGSGSNFSRTQLFDWYQSDFENHLYKGQRVGSFQKFIEIYSNSQVSGAGTPVNYDWSLNIL